MHFQRPPAEESKLVRCSRGTIFDVIIDLRRDSATYGKHFAVELSDDSHRALFVPKGFAHGFQALSDEVMVEYQMGAYYSPNEATGIRYDDPAFAIEWPLPVTTISEQDLSWPRFRL
jgi:dTDP-4-dehydrorhamnose 3,5-epimerase